MNDRLRTAGDDVDALLRRLRAQIAERRRHQPPADADAGGTRIATEGAQAAALPLDLRRAALLADVGTALPSFDHLSPLRRLVARTAGRGLLYLLRLITVDQQQFNHVVVRALQELRADLAAGNERLALLAADEAAIDRRFEQLATDETSLTHCLEQMAADLAGSDQRVAALQSRLDDALAGRGAQLAALEATQATHAQRLAALHDASEMLRAQADVLRRRIAAVGEPPSAAARSAALVAAPAPPPDDGEAAVDTWLVSQAFRGSEADLAARQRQYVPYFAGRSDVLDVGCGRGEFLQLLREAGVSARGIDSDRDMALWGHEKGLDVTCTDALTYLAHQPEASLGGIFCAQVVEHLATPDMLRFIQLAHRALRPDGLLLVETLNPESLLVLYRWFWVDLTHERLVHPETLKFVLQSCGFRDIDVHFVPPPDGPLRLPLLELPGVPPEQLAPFNTATQYLNDLLYGSFDYAVMGIR